MLFQVNAGNLPARISRGFLENPRFSRGISPHSAWQCRRERVHYESIVRGDDARHADAATDAVFMLSIHEHYGEQETRDIVDALAKVEAAYLQ